jgi:hypothetical protein
MPYIKAICKNHTIANNEIHGPFEPILTSFVQLRNLLALPPFACFTEMRNDSGTREGCRPDLNSPYTIIADAIGTAENMPVDRGWFVYGTLFAKFQYREVENKMNNLHLLSEKYRTVGASGV